MRRKAKIKKIKIYLIIFAGGILVGFGIFFLFNTLRNQDNTKKCIIEESIVKENSNQGVRNNLVINPTPGPDLNNADNLENVIYPLYPNLSWNTESATTTVAFGMYLTGSRINSNPISDTTYDNLISLFNNYYDTQLTAAGWEINKDYVADGPGTSIWAYTKGSKIIVLSYVSDELNPSKNKPFSCPCKMTFSIFSGEIK